LIPAHSIFASYLQKILRLELFKQRKHQENFKFPTCIRSIAGGTIFAGRIECAGGTIFAGRIDCAGGTIFAGGIVFFAQFSGDKFSFVVSV
jgi:hypothetical protein